MSEITETLSRIEVGEPAAAEQLLPLVYNDLRRLAQAKLSAECPGHTLQATALVHEAYMRLVGDDGQQPFNSRNHFFAAAAEAMRRILIDNARRKQTEKHGGRFARVDLESADVFTKDHPDQILALNAALDEFHEIDPDKANLVKLRFFAGLTIEEAAALLGISATTAKRHWTYARAWLDRQMRFG